MPQYCNVTVRRAQQGGKLEPDNLRHHLRTQTGSGFVTGTTNYIYIKMQRNSKDQCRENVSR